MHGLPMLVCVFICYVSIKTTGTFVDAEDATDTTRYYNLDVDSILSSSRLAGSYANCLLDKGPCTDEGHELKKYLPEALASECSKCSPIQKKQAGKVLSVLLKNYRDTYWKDLIAKYDPDGNFQKKYAINDVEGEVEDYSDLEEA